MSAEYFYHKGIWFSTVINSVEAFDYVENEFQVLDDDVINVTFPKSGTHWMGEILSLIRHGGDPTWVRSVPSWERLPWIDSAEGTQSALTSSPPRLLTSHLPFQMFPKSFHHSKAKVIYTVRNPKDVMISMYHFSKIFKPLKDPGPLEEFMEDFLKGNVTYGSWFEHVKGWMKLKDKENFFSVAYEELQQDLRGCVEKICRFIGKELTGQQIDAVVENASFQKMKDNKMSNLTLLPESFIDHQKGQLLRKGISGDWKNHLTEAQSKHFDQVYQENMRGFSMTFPWE